MALPFDGSAEVKRMDGQLERLLREFVPGEDVEADVSVMRGLYECLSACAPYFVDSGYARTALRSAVGGDVQRYAMACVDARQLLWSEESFAEYHRIMPYKPES
jgi:hypothetical protein